MKKFNQLLFLSSLLLILSTAQADLVLSQSSFITQDDLAIATTAFPPTGEPSVLLMDLKISLLLL